MISTVTTTTVTTVASTTLAGGLGLLATLVLIALLITKELAGAGVDAADVTGNVTLARAVDRVLNVGIVPLLLVFAVIVITKVVAVLH